MSECCETKRSCSGLLTKFFPGSTENGNVRIRYLIGGQNICGVYVALHGIGLDPWSWECLFQRVKKLGFLFIAPETRGFGASDPGFDNLSDLSLTNSAADVHAILGYIGEHTNNLVIHGQSYASGIAFQYYANYITDTEFPPNQLIIDAGSARFFNVGTYDVSFDPSVAAVFTFLVDSGVEVFSAVLIALALNDDIRCPDQLKQLNKLANKLFKVATQTSIFNLTGTLLTAFFNMDFRALLPTITIPTLVIFGSKDQVVPIGNSYYIASHIPRSQIEQIRGAGHWTNVTAACEAANRIVRFLVNPDNFYICDFHLQLARCLPSAETAWAEVEEDVEPLIALPTSDVFDPIQLATQYNLYPQYAKITLDTPTQVASTSVASNGVNSADYGGHGYKKHGGDSSHKKRSHRKRRSCSCNE